MRAIPRPPGWAAGVFSAALLARLAFLLVVDQPLVYTHQYTYLNAALRIAEHPEPVRYVLTSDEWRTWDQHWTIAPLYHLFAAALFRLFGPHLLVLQLAQALLDALAAVAVAALGRQAAGTRGAWAGVAYAFYWPAIELPSWTMTENVHTPLFVGAVAILACEPLQSGRANALLGGFLVGLAALARSVSTVFLGLAALARVWSDGLRRGFLPAALVFAGGMAMILPWTARNVFVIGEPVLIESAAFENIWYANHFGDAERFRREQEIVAGLPTSEAKRAAALRFALENVREHPDLFAGKVWDHFWHFLRPDWVDSLLRVERPLPAAQYAVGIALEDLPLLSTLPLFLVFLASGPPSPARRLILLWTAYYLGMIVVVFHNELRYRSALVPFAFAGAAGGLALLRDPEARRRWPLRAALAVGLVLCAAVAGPYLWPAVRAARMAATTGAIPAAVARGDLAEAERRVAEAAALDPRSPRPWLAYGRALAHAGHPAEAVLAYRRAQGSPKPAQWTPKLALPRLLREAGRQDEAERALHDAHVLSWAHDPWLMLEAAWRELPPPRTDTIEVGGDDYGAVRGFFHPRGLDPRTTRRYLTWNRYEGSGPEPPPGLHRWTRHRAWLRLVPSSPARDYEVTLEMGSPFPSPLASPEATVRTGADAPVRFTLTVDVRPYALRASAPPDGVLVVRVEAPTWTRRGEPAEQGVRIDRMSVRPLP